MANLLDFMHQNATHKNADRQVKAYNRNFQAEKQNVCYL